MLFVVCSILSSTKKGVIIVNKLTQSLVLAGLVSIPASAMADNNASIPTFSQIMDASGISLTGYLDVAYNNMNSTGQFVTGPVNSHIFDTPNGATSPTKDYSQFNFQQFAVIVAKQPKEGFGGLVNLTTGQDAIEAASYGLGGGNNNHVFDLTQAYGSYATGPLTVIAGKFATLAGAELITSPSNSNYTHAWMFGWGPYTHTGVRATYVASDKVTLIAGINNGFDQVSSASSGKTGEFGIDIMPSSMFSLATTYYIGKGMLNANNVANIGTGNYLDIVGTINATDKLNFVFDYANASQDGVAVPGAAGTIGKAKWDSLALYANYHFSDRWRISYRNENFNDKDGYRSGLLYDGINVVGGPIGTPAGQRLKSNTLTLGFAPVKSFELRAEARWDKSNVNSFLQTNGTGKSTQTTYALDAVYQF